MATNNAINNLSTSPTAVAFEATLSAVISNVTGDATVYGPVGFAAETYDPFNCFDTATFVFTAPATSIYYLMSFVEMKDVPASDDCYIELVTTKRSYKSDFRNINITKSSLNPVYVLRVISVVDMDIGDTAYINVCASNSTKTIDLEYTSLTDLRCIFQGFKLQGY